MRTWRPGGTVVGDGDGAAAVVGLGISVLDLFGRCERPRRVDATWRILLVCNQTPFVSVIQ